ncbi:MAG: L,D-transpeptidase [Prevotella sp.]|jgi:murein L,D-transpeptidase YcbB/YkuD|nr:L,D-transpeptidase [Prevotella sp.]
MEAFSDMKTPAFVLSAPEIRQQLAAMAGADGGKTEADHEVRKYYKQDHAPILWVDAAGVDQRADSLLAWLHQLGEIGLSEQAFGVKAIENDLNIFRSLGFDDDKNTASRVAARLEYRLTKACMRYCYGQRFGFVNPHRTLNKLDIEKQDTVRRYVKYRGLFDVDIDSPDDHYASSLASKIAGDSIAGYLREIQPRDAFYQRLKSMLPQASTPEQRQRIMVNMERCRWRRHQPIATEGKRIVVNIPAFHLYAFSPQETLDMRVVCGGVNTKTPQLSSNIEWMEANPQWVIPTSIIENEVARRAGDSAYFARNRYNIVDKSSGQTLDASQVSRQMLLSGKYRIAQKGGTGNSLGRIVFRFKNSFSVFLHDTSTPGAFQRDTRALSHGCVRVSKPFELARFVLDSPDEWLLDRIRIAMGMTPETEQGQQWLHSHPDPESHNKIIGYIPVTPRVPLFIIYYTLWPDEAGVLQTWPDVYGYDKVMWNQLKTFVE